MVEKRFLLSWEARVVCAVALGLFLSPGCCTKLSSSLEAKALPVSQVQLEAVAVQAALPLHVSLNLLGPALLTRGRFGLHGSWALTLCRER